MEAVSHKNPVPYGSQSKHDISSGYKIHRETKEHLLESTAYHKLHAMAEVAKGQIPYKGVHKIFLLRRRIKYFKPTSRCCSMFMRLVRS